MGNEIVEYEISFEIWRSGPHKKGGGGFLTTKRLPISRLFIRKMHKILVRGGARNVEIYRIKRSIPTLEEKRVFLKDLKRL